MHSEKDKRTLKKVENELKHLEARDSLHVIFHSSDFFDKKHDEMTYDCINQKVIMTKNKNPNIMAEYAHILGLFSVFMGVVLYNLTQV